MLLSKEDALYASKVFNDYFGQFDRIDAYNRKIKLERMESFPDSLPGFGPENDFFNTVDVHPSEMNFKIDSVPMQQFHQYLEIVTSAPVEMSIPGKQMNLIVKETTTNTVVGMIRFGSPTINSKPRNTLLGQPLDTLNPEVMKRFNDSVIMGFAIVPVQPFGFNYLGGKLLSAICCSHEVRERLNKKYDSNICMFETTSLYGSTKQMSQYDGMKPILRFSGLTDSKFLPLINDDTFRSLHQFFIDRNGGEPLVPKEASSRKLKAQTKMIGIIKASLKNNEGYDEFCQTISTALDLTQRKRSFYSTYGYENVMDYLNLKTDTLIKKENFDRFYFDSQIEWWKNKASKRYDSLKSDGRLRTVLETWNTNPEDIDIIR